jgi:hypothetical protein
MPPPLDDRCLFGHGVGRLTSDHHLLGSRRNSASFMVRPVFVSPPAVSERHLASGLDDYGHVTPAGPALPFTVKLLPWPC